ncbi:MAG: ribonuclease HII [Deltaproteobacteria bacterium]|nr:MAG: ribonuclease HII [Deltaproteobacteria bacterium]
MELRGVSLAEIRRRYVREGGRVSGVLRVALRDDPRVGAQDLLRNLDTRRRRVAAEQRRLRRLFALEHDLHQQGVEHVAGVDEVGVGPLAGPVVAASVVLPPAVRLPGLNDSKRLTRAARERIAAEIEALACATSVGWASSEEIDQLNIYHAALLAMRRAVEGLARAPDMLLVDAREVPGLALPQRAIVGGDARVGCIAAASVLAKVHRDAFMRELDQLHPGYGFASNAGYGTAEHLRALQRLGPTPIHRRSFAPVYAVSGGTEH